MNKRQVTVKTWNLCQSLWLIANAFPKSASLWSNNSSKAFGVLFISPTYCGVAILWRAKNNYKALINNFRMTPAEAIQTINKQSKEQGSSIARCMALTSTTKKRYEKGAFIGMQWTTWLTLFVLAVFLFECHSGGPTCVKRATWPGLNTICMKALLCCSA